MPIMAAHARSDARGNAQLLASMALESVCDPAVAREQRVALNNAYRLIESFRTDTSFGSGAPSRQPDQHSLRRLALRRPVERHVSDVRLAIDEALGVAFGAAATTEEAAGIVAGVLRAIAYPEAVKLQPSPEDRDKTVTFLQELVRRLNSD